MTYTLITGNKNYSSWSLRPWLALKAFQLPFQDVAVKFDTEDFKRIVAQYSPAGQVPILIDGDLVVWDSLAIVEYLAEHHPKMWPSESSARAIARSFCAEMHAGFRALRTRMPMCVRRSFPVTPDADVAKDIARIEAMWTAARRRAKQRTDAGPYLFGEFTIVDAYFAPVVFRFRTYGATLNGVCNDYMRAMLAHPAMREWEDGANAETEVVDYDEPEAIYGSMG
jgi:glutathione S-transferase